MNQMGQMGQMNQIGNNTSTGLFGNTAAAIGGAVLNNAVGGGTGLFSGTNNQQNQAGGGLFGGLNNTTKTGLFDQQSNNNMNQTGLGMGLGGNMGGGFPTQQQNPFSNQQGGSNLFGNSPTPNQNSGGIFGNTQQPNQNSGMQNSLFGPTSQQPLTSSQPQASYFGAAAPAAPMDPSLIWIAALQLQQYLPKM